MQTIQQKTLSDTMYYGKIPVFIYNIHYPFFKTTCSKASSQRINDYYAYTSRQTEKYCRTVLFPQAVDNARYIPSNQPPFNSYTLDLNYKITYNTGCITSLYFEQYTYMGGAHGATVRNSDTWDFKTGRRLTLGNFYPLSPASLQQLFNEMEQQVVEKQKASPSSFFDDYSSLLQKTFNPKSYYLTNDGVIIYYQQYDVAPYATGLPEFLFPYQDM